jgi:acyl-homoserine-lactone acylase
MPSPRRSLVTRFLSLLAGLAMLGLVARTAVADAVSSESTRWQARAANVTILRDTWGIAHVFGKSDADAVFGLVYAQAEDDFNRVELNYVNALGRLAEIEGEKEIYRDLRMKLFIDPADLQAKYAQSPSWLRSLMDAFADGLNYFLATHPSVKPKLITHFEPWMALSFTEGSIGGDIESISLRGLEDFYGPRSSARSVLTGRAATPSYANATADEPLAAGRALSFVTPFLAADDFTPARRGAESPPYRDPAFAEPRGSNGFAIAPANTVNHHALLLLNPHTSFYFRPEIHAVSQEGLNAYGAVTWGQFFIYQGFNDRLGWMHTSGGGDVIDEYLETIVDKPDGPYYRYGSEERKVTSRQIALPFKQGAGVGSKTVTAYFTHHGPIIRATDGQWVSVRLMQEPVKALTQSYQRTKARNYADFYATMELRTNSSNNTVYADADGNIAYFHGDFIPIRDPQFDWKKPVDGSNPATDWKGLHDVKDIIHLFNPPNGWVYNTNNWPFTAAGPNSPKPSAYPAYMWSNPENPRGINAVRVLSGKKDFTLDRLIAAANDPRLSAFETLIPALVKAFDSLAASDPLKSRLADQMAVLRAWDCKYGVDSVATSLAVYWGDTLQRHVAEAARSKGVAALDYMETSTSAQEKLQALVQASDKIAQDFGQWRTPWGEINRFQRLTGNVEETYDDTKPSLPVGFTSSTWGSLAAFGISGTVNKTKHIYANRGNSFVAVVEFGPRIIARSVLAGGVSGDPASKHFNDQAELYSKGQFKDVWFYREDIEQHLERRYAPGK